MPNQNAPPKVAAPQSEAPAIKNDRAPGEIRSQIIREYIASGQPTPEKNWLYSRLIEIRDALLSAERQRRELRKGLELALIPMAALVVSGECVNAPTALTEELKQAILTAHDEIVKLLAPEAETLLEGETK